MFFEFRLLVGVDLNIVVLFGDSDELSGSADGHPLLVLKH